MNTLHYSSQMTRQQAFERFLLLVSDAEGDLKLIKKLQIEYDYILPYLLDSKTDEYKTF